MDIKWQLFYGVDGENTDLASLSEIPEELAGVKGENISFCDNFYTRKSSGAEIETGVFAAEWDMEEETVVSLGFGGCYYYQVFFNGISVLDRRESGNKPYFPPRFDNFTVPVTCRKGKNILAVALKTSPGNPLMLAFKVRDDYNYLKCQPVIDNFSALINSSAYPPEGSCERKECCQMIQNGVLQMRNTVFNPYAVNFSMPEAEVESLTTQYPILWFYEKALDRIIREISTVSPKEEEIYFWHLYNMGYVIKSSETTFGLDLNHRRAVELAPHIDFVMTTHNHIDHQDSELFKALAAEKKQIFTNFYPAPGFHRPPAELEINGLKIITQENDHNPTLQKFVTSYYLTFPNGCILFATGDSRNVEQLNPAGTPDIFIPHPRVGLSVPAAVEKFHPRAVLYSHFLEMRHCPPTPWYAVPYDLLYEERSRVEKSGTAALAPLWGEKLVWNNNEKRFI